ncbi:MAG: hypothetical protein H6Q39_1888, partial [Chloroflexi bacterium]|nr:hypothetical protein [Chloroflexota bacterium]
VAALIAGSILASILLRKPRAEEAPSEPPPEGEPRKKE